MSGREAQKVSNSMCVRTGWTESSASRAHLNEMQMGNLEKDIWDVPHQERLHRSLRRPDGGVYK
jgi:hypothetical protein